MGRGDDPMASLGSSVRTQPTTGPMVDFAAARWYPIDSHTRELHHLSELWQQAAGLLSVNKGLSRSEVC